MAGSISIKAMAAKTKSRFRAPMLLSVLTFAAALAAIWIVREYPHDYFGRRSFSDPLAVTVFEAMLSGLCFSVAGTLLAEEMQRVRLRTVLSFVGFSVGAGLYCLCSGFTPSADKCACLAAVAFLLCCALIARGDRPKEALWQALGCFLVCGAISALVMLVLYLLLGAAVTAMFISGTDWELLDPLAYTAFALAALVLAPFMLFSFFPDRDTPRAKYSGLKKVLAYVILPAYLALLAVLLVYIVAVVIKWELPAGRMNPYAMLALGTFAFLHLLLTGEENRLSRFFVFFGVWLLLPVIVVQAVAVFIRIDAYGLTQARIFGLAFSVACLVTVAAAFWRKYGRVFFIVSAVLLFVLAATPLNAQTLACRNQESRLFGALTNAQMLDETGRIVPNENAAARDRKIIWSSAEFLNYNREGLAENSRAADYIRQLDAVTENFQTVSIRFANFSTFAKLLFGFDDPGRSWYSETQRATGASSESELEVEGFRHARLLLLQFDEESDWRAEAGGETIQIDALLAYADFESGTFKENDVPLPGGHTLRINYLDRTEETPAEGSASVHYTLSAWLLTP